MYENGKTYLQSHFTLSILAATKQLEEHFCLSVCPSVCPSDRLLHLFYNVPVIVSSWHFQELLPMTEVMSIEKAKVIGKRWRS